MKHLHMETMSVLIGILHGTPNIWSHSAFVLNGDTGEERAVWVGTDMLWGALKGNLSLPVHLFFWLVMPHWYSGGGWWDKITEMLSPDQLFVGWDDALLSTFESGTPHTVSKQRQG